MLSTIRSYGLAWCCVLGPLLALLVYGLTLLVLVPASATSIEFTYHSKAGTQATPASAAKRSGDAKAGSAPAQSDRRGDVKADPTMHAVALHLSGRSGYATASAFLYLASVAAFIFGLVVALRRLKPISVAIALVLLGLASWAIAYWAPKPRGRHLVVEALLNKADQFDELKRLAVAGSATGDTVASLVSFNTFVCLLSVGMILTALFALSIRPQDADLDDSELKSRLVSLRLALALASAILVIGVLANKALVDWPLNLVADAEAAALKPIADMLTLQLGAIASIALFAAFAPAIIAWALDVQRYRALTGATDSRDAADLPVTAIKRNSADARTGKPAGGDNLVFARFSAFAAIVAVFAPVLASPFVDAVKAILLAIPGK